MLRTQLCENDEYATVRFIIILLLFYYLILFNNGWPFSELQLIFKGPF